MPFHLFFFLILNNMYIQLCLVIHNNTKFKIVLKSRKSNSDEDKMTGELRR